MKRSTKPEPSPAAAAACGAAAGLIGGIVLTALDRLVVPRLDDAAQREHDWDEGVADAATRLGVRLSRRERATAGIATALAYAALLGAGYGLARRRLRSSPATLRLLDAVLVYAGSLIAPQRRRRSRHTRRRPTRAAAMRTVSSGSVFGTTTVAAYKALSRRVG